jgi:hypothetical protein
VVLAASSSWPRSKQTLALAPQSSPARSESNQAQAHNLIAKVRKEKLLVKKGKGYAVER